MNKNKVLQRPLIVAHRGAMSSAPENTRPAFEAALKCSVYGLEMDVQMTSDGVPVLYHDMTLQKVAGRRKHIHEQSYAELKKMDWGGWFSPEYRGERLMTLKKALQLYSGRTAMMIEIKSRRYDRRSGRGIVLTHKILELISEEVEGWILGNIYILSFDINVLRSAHETAPGLKYVMNIGRSRRFYKKIKCAPGFLCGISLPIRRLEKPAVDLIRSSGKLVLTYSCNLKRQAAKALSLNTDIIMSNKPDWLIKYINENGIK